jgi:hypothetical protein
MNILNYIENENKDIFTNYVKNILSLKKIGFSKFDINIIELNNEDIEYLKNIDIKKIINRMIVPNYKNMIRLLKIGINIEYSYYKSIDNKTYNNIECITQLKNAGFEDKYIFSIIPIYISNFKNIINLKEYGFKDELFFTEVLKLGVCDDKIKELKSLKDLCYEDMDCLYIYYNEYKKRNPFNFINLF